MNKKPICIRMPAFLFKNMQFNLWMSLYPGSSGICERHEWHWLKQGSDSEWRFAYPWHSGLCKSQALHMASVRWLPTLWPSECRQWKSRCWLPRCPLSPCSLRICLKRKHCRNWHIIGKQYSNTFRLLPEQKCQLRFVLTTWKIILRVYRETGMWKSETRFIKWELRELAFLFYSEVC